MRRAHFDALRDAVAASGGTEVETTATSFVAPIGCRSSSSPPIAIWISMAPIHSWAEMCVARTGPGDGARAEGLASLALETAKSLGLARVEVLSRLVLDRL